MPGSAGSEFTSLYHRQKRSRSQPRRAFLSSVDSLVKEKERSTKTLRLWYNSLYHATGYATEPKVEGFYQLPFVEVESIPVIFNGNIQ